MTNRRRQARRTTLGSVMALLTVMSLGGCGIFRHHAPPEPEVTRPEEEEPAPPAPAPATPEPPRRPKSESRPAPARATVKPDTLVKAAPDTTPPPPLLQLRLSQEDRTARERQYAEDVARARAALEALARVMLTTDQAGQKRAAEKFLADAELAFGAADLPRATALAQKSRIMAEELRSAAVPQSP